MGLTEANQVLTLNNLRHRVHAAHRRRPPHRPRHRHRRDAGRRGVRHRHGLAGRHGLHHGAPVPFQHLPGRRLHAGRGAARQVHRHAGEGRQPVQLHRRGGARDPGLARLPLAERGRSAAPTCWRRSAAARAHLDDLDLNPLLVQADPGGAPALLHARGPQRGARHAGRADRRATPRALLERGEKMQLDLQRAQHARAPSARGSRSHIVAQVRHDRAARPAT